MKAFMKAFKGLHKTLHKTTKKCENKNLSYIHFNTTFWNARGEKG